MEENHRMTWKEFKELVNNQNVPDDAMIEYADFSFPMYGDKITVFYDPEWNEVSIH